MENLSLKMNYFKKRLKLTNEKISRLAGVPVATVERISSGRTKNPNLKTLKALAKVFECTLDDLMNLKDTQRPYHLDEITAKMAETLTHNENLKTLFDLVMNLPDSDIQSVIGLAERLVSTKGEDYARN